MLTFPLSLSHTHRQVLCLTFSCLLPFRLGDLCPSLRLRQGDFVFAKQGYALQKKLIKAQEQKTLKAEMTPFLHPTVLLTSVTKVVSALKKLDKHAVNEARKDTETEAEKQTNEKAENQAKSEAEAVQQSSSLS